jgi:ankyrin repeat protein
MSQQRNEMSPSDSGLVLLSAIGLDDAAAALAALDSGAQALVQFGSSPLNRAVQCDSSRCARAMMDRGEDWRARDQKDENALDVAAKLDSVGCVGAIMERPEASAELASRALVHACKASSWRAAHLIVEAMRGKEPELFGVGMALIEAIKCGEIRCVETVLSLSPESDGEARAWEPKLGIEAMALACQRRNALALKALLSAGWDSNACVDRTYHVGAMDWTSRRHLSRVTREGGISCIEWAVFNFAWECVDVLLDHGARVELANRQGVTMLMCVARCGDQIDIARKLIACGVDVNGQDAQGCTALMCCARELNPEASESMTRILLASGGDALARDHKGRDVLDWHLSRPCSAKDIEALCETVDPRERMARLQATVKKWRAIGAWIERRSRAWTRIKTLQAILASVAEMFALSADDKQASIALSSNPAIEWALRQAAMAWSARQERNEIGLALAEPALASAPAPKKMRL